MATREVWIERKSTAKTRYCAFARADGDIFAVARRRVRFLNLATLAPAVFFCALFVLGFAKANLPMLLTAPLIPSVFAIMQTAAQSRVAIEYRGNDGLDCTVRHNRITFSRPSSFRVEIPESSVDIALRFSRKGDATVKISGETALTVKPRRARGQVVRPRSLHLDFKDQAGRTAALDQAPEQRHTYRLLYDEGFQPERLLFIMAATFLLR